MIARGAPGPRNGGHPRQARGVLLALPVNDTFPLPSPDGEPEPKWMSILEPI